MMKPLRILTIFQIHPVPTRSVQRQCSLRINSLPSTVPLWWSRGRGRICFFLWYLKKSKWESRIKIVHLEIFLWQPSTMGSQILTIGSLWWPQGVSVFSGWKASSHHCHFLAMFRVASDLEKSGKLESLHSLDTTENQLPNRKYVHQNFQTNITIFYLHNWAHYWGGTF